MSDNASIKQLVDIVKQIFADKADELDKTEMCKVLETNDAGLLDVVLLSDPDTRIKNIPNQTVYDFNTGDIGLLYKVGNRINNSFIIAKFNLTQQDINKRTSENDVSKIVYNITQTGSSGGAVVDLSAYATKSYVDARILTGAGAPTTATVGTIGQLYEDTTNGKVYQCEGTTDGVYTWRMLPKILVGNTEPTTSTVGEVGQLYEYQPTGAAENGKLYQCVKVSTGTGTTSYKWVEKLDKFNPNEYMQITFWNKSTSSLKTVKIPKKYVAYYVDENGETVPKLVWDKSSLKDLTGAYDEQWNPVTLTANDLAGNRIVSSDDRGRIKVGEPDSSSSSMATNVGYVHTNFPYLRLNKDGWKNFDKAIIVPANCQSGNNIAMYEVSTDITNLHTNNPSIPLRDPTTKVIKAGEGAADNDVVINKQLNEVEEDLTNSINIMKNDLVISGGAYGTSAGNPVVAKDNLTIIMNDAKPTTTMSVYVKQFKMNSSLYNFHIVTSITSGTPTSIPYYIFYIYLNYHGEGLPSVVALGNNITAKSQGGGSGFNNAIVIQYTASSLVKPGTDISFNLYSKDGVVYVANADGAMNADDFVKKNADITGATKCKITYDSKGLVTAGADLTDSDIPSLDASKITTGTFADARIAGASKWDAKASTSYVDGKINSLGSAAKKDVDTSINPLSSSANLPTTDAVKTYVANTFAGGYLGVVSSIEEVTSKSAAVSGSYVRVQGTFDIGGKTAYEGDILVLRSQPYSTIGNWDIIALSDTMFYERSKLYVGAGSIEYASDLSIVFNDVDNDKSYYIFRYDANYAQTSTKINAIFDVSKKTEGKSDNIVFDIIISNNIENMEFVESPDVKSYTAVPENAISFANDGNNKKTILRITLPRSTDDYFIKADMRIRNDSVYLI